MSLPNELPKGLLRYMMERLLPRDLRGEAIRGDLLEEFRARAEQSSEREARLWYRRQGRRILWALALGRISRAELKAGASVGQTPSRWLDEMLRDIVRALRGMRNSPGFTVITVGTLALGIGATTSIFTVVNGVLLKPLPFEDPDELVGVWNRTPRTEAFRLSPAQYFTYRD